MSRMKTRNPAEGRPPSALPPPPGDPEREGEDTEVLPLITVDDYYDLLMEQQEQM